MSDQILDATMRWLNIVSSEVSSRSKRKNYYEAHDVLSQNRTATDNNIFDLCIRQLNIILENNAFHNESSIKAARLCLLAIFVLENEESNTFTTKNDILNGFVSLCKASCAPLYFCLKAMVITESSSQELRKMAGWYHDCLEDDLIALGRGHILTNTDSFLNNIRELKTQLLHCIDICK